MAVNKRLNKAIMEVVENQLRDNDPPETTDTLVRLVAEGHSESEAKRMIACVVSTSIHEIMKEQKPFDLERYIEALKALPKMPWE